MSQNNVSENARFFRNSSSFFFFLRKICVYGQINLENGTRPSSGRFTVHISILEALRNPEQKKTTQAIANGFR